MSDIEAGELASRLGELPVLDVRTPAEFDGTHGKPCDPRQGHIPGARNVDLYRLMELQAGDVAAVIGVEPGGEVVAYCHSGSRSGLAVHVLRSLGYEARNYVGSWHEWSRRDDLPIES